MDLHRFNLIGCDVIKLLTSFLTIGEIIHLAHIGVQIPKKLIKCGVENCEEIRTFEHHSNCPLVPYCYYYTNPNVVSSFCSQHYSHCLFREPDSSEICGNKIGYSCCISRPFLCKKHKNKINKAISVYLNDKAFKLHCELNEDKKDWEFRDVDSGPPYIEDIAHVIVLKIIPRNYQDEITHAVAYIEDSSYEIRYWKRYIYEEHFFDSPVSLYKNHPHIVDNAIALLNHNQWIIGNFEQSYRYVGR